MPHEETCVVAGYLGLFSFKPHQSEPIARYEWQGSTVRLAVSPNQRFIATGDQDCTVHFWRSSKPNADESAMMSGFATEVEALSWDSESRYLATGGSCDICLWDCLQPGPEGRPPKTLKGDPEALITEVAFQPKGNWLASGTKRERSACGTIAVGVLLCTAGSWTPPSRNWPGRRTGKHWPSGAETGSSIKLLPQNRWQPTRASQDLSRQISSFE